MKYPDIVYRMYEKVFPWKAHRPFTRFIKIKYKDNVDGLVGCEIGTYKGNNARSMLDFLPVKMLYLIDPYQSNYDITDEFSENRGYNRYYNMAKRNLRRYKGRYHFIKKTSDSAISDIPGKKNFFDFVYIDGNHNYSFVKKDIELYYQLVKPGGILGGHDYLLWNGVHKAVDELLVEKDLEIMGWCHDWWIVKH